MWVLFQSSFMRISFCKIYASSCNFSNTILSHQLSILFYEDFFLQVFEYYFLQMSFNDVFSAFNPLLWGFLFASMKMRYVMLRRRVDDFQSSFMRISFCKLPVLDILLFFRSVCSFNPLLWGFLFASVKGIYFLLQVVERLKVLSILFYEDFFLQVVLLAYSNVPGNPLSILFYEDFFLQDYVDQRLKDLERARKAFQSSFMRISFCKLETIWCWLYLEWRCFQSSFMRISFCKDLWNSKISKAVSNCFSFNPLLWGFLFASRRP